MYVCAALPVAFRQYWKEEEYEIMNYEYENKNTKKRIQIMLTAIANDRQQDALVSAAELHSE